MKGNKNKFIKGNIKYQELELDKTTTSLYFKDAYTSVNKNFESQNPNMIVFDNADNINISGNAIFVSNGNSKGEIELNGNYNFFSPYEFTTSSIKYVRDFNNMITEVGVAKGWSTITLPFTPATITGTNSEETDVTLKPFNNGTIVSGTNPFWLREMTTDGLHEYFDGPQQEFSFFVVFIASGFIS